VRFVMAASERERTITTIDGVHLFTADDYIKMIEVGILAKEDRVELIGG
jgi:hypothetical protein